MKDKICLKIFSNYLTPVKELTKNGLSYGSCTESRIPTNSDLSRILIYLIKWNIQVFKDFPTFSNFPMYTIYNCTHLLK